MEQFKNMGIYLSAVIGVLLIIDVFLYSAGIFPVSNTTYYPDIGKGLRADFSYIYFNEGFAIGKTNEYGYYGYGYPKKTGADAFRIALIGDSYVEGIQVFNRNHFATILEDQLNNGYTRTEVLNFGRSAFVLGNMYAYQQTLVHTFDPDVYLYFLSESNLETTSSDPSLATVIYDKDSLLAVKPYSTKSYIRNYKKANRFLKKSTLLYALNNSKRYFNTENFKKLFGFGAAPVPDNSRSGKLTAIPKISRDILANLDKNKTIIVWKDLKKPPGFLIDYLRQLDVGFIDLSGTFDLMIKQGNNPTYWKVTDKYGHFNNHAHRIMGERLAQELIKRNLR